MKKAREIINTYRLQKHDHITNPTLTIWRNNEIFLRNIYGIENIDNVDPILDEDIIKTFSNLSNSDFYNIFKVEKEDLFDIDGVFLEEKVKNKEKYKEAYLFYKMISKISKIGDFREIFLKNYYETYTISVNPKDYYYFDITGKTSDFENDPAITETYEVDENNESLVNYIKTNLSEFPDRVGSLKKSYLNIENTKIIIRSEII